MRRSLIGLLGLLWIVSCSPQPGSPPPEQEAPRYGRLEKALEGVYMEDRIRSPYRGGDIGDYLSQFVWGDNALLLSYDEFQPFVELFDAVRAAAEDQDLANHSPITQDEVRLIFYEAFPGESPFGDDPEFRVPVERFYEVLDSYRGRTSTNPQVGYPGVN